MKKKEPDGAQGWWNPFVLNLFVKSLELFDSKDLLLSKKSKYKKQGIAELFVQMLSSTSIPIWCSLICRETKHRDKNDTT